MKKIVAFILTLCLCSGLILTSKVIKANADESAKSYEVSGLGVAPHVILNQETGCYDIDVYAMTVSTQYVSNFTASFELYYVGNEQTGKVKTTAQSYVGGTVTGGLEDLKQYVEQSDVDSAGDSASNKVYRRVTFRVAFNASKNVDLSKSCEMHGSNAGQSGDAYIGRIAKIKTDLKIASSFDTNSADVGLYVIYGEIESAGYMDGKKVVNYEDEAALPMSLCFGDFDFDGEITARDLVTAQYYYVNNIMFNEEIGDVYVYPNQTMSFMNRFCRDSSLQYLQMYLCEQITYSEYMISVMMASSGGGSEPGDSSGGGTGKAYDYPDGNAGEFYDTLWDYGRTAVTDGVVTFYGEDSHGNYHFWITDDDGSVTGRFFTVINSSKRTVTIYSYSLDKTKIIINAYFTSYVDIKFIDGWDDEYWDGKTPGEDDEYIYKGADEYGNTHIWSKTNPYQKMFQTKYGDEIAYLINPETKEAVILGKADDVWQFCHIRLIKYSNKGFIGD